VCVCVCVCTCRCVRRVIAMKKFGVGCRPAAGCRLRSDGRLEPERPGGCCCTLLWGRQARAVLFLSEDPVAINGGAGHAGRLLWKKWRMEW